MLLVCAHIQSCWLHSACSPLKLSLRSLVSRDRCSGSKLITYAYHVIEHMVLSLEPEVQDGSHARTRVSLTSIHHYYILLPRAGSDCEKMSCGCVF